MGSRALIETTGIGAPALRRTDAPSVPLGASAEPTRGRPVPGHRATGELDDGTSCLPRTSRRVQGLFAAYARYYLARHFHGVRVVDGSQRASLVGHPLIVYQNHPSWWDPMVSTALAFWLTPDRTHFVPIDAEALERYRFFSRLGFFGVRRDHVSGARAFLRCGVEVARRPDAALWVTPQGQFRDARSRPGLFESGLGRLATRVAREHAEHPDRPEPAFLPVAVEYTFWDEKLPEALLWIGPPVWASALDRRSSAASTELLERRLVAAQDRLRDAACSRSASAFETIVRGRTGVGAIYDGWRWFRSRLGGERFRRAHGEEER